MFIIKKTITYKEFLVLLAIVLLLYRSSLRFPALELISANLLPYCYVNIMSERHYFDLNNVLCCLAMVTRCLEVLEAVCLVWFGLMLVLLY